MGACVYAQRGGRCALAAPTALPSHTITATAAAAATSIGTTSVFTTATTAATATVQVFAYRSPQHGDRSRYYHRRRCRFRRGLGPRAGVGGWSARVAAGGGGRCYGVSLDLGDPTNLGLALERLLKRCCPSALETDRSASLH